MTTRRDLLAGAAALAAAPSIAFAAETEDQKLHAMLTANFEDFLARSPETATNLGLDRGALAWLKYELAARSPEAAAELREDNAVKLRALRRIKRDQLGEQSRLSYDVADFQLDTAVALGSKHMYHTSVGRAGPYAVTQLSGAYFTVPDFLANQHRVDAASDVDGYLARLAKFAEVLDQETSRIRYNDGRGSRAPDFVLDKTIAQLKQLRDTPVESSTLVTGLTRRAEAKGLGDHRAAASAVVSGPIREALSRQIETLERHRGGATHDAGVWRLPDGDAYYAGLLRLNTTTTMGAEEIHRTGLEQVAELSSRIDALLKAQGYTQGSVGERLNALNREARFLWPNTDEGRAGLLASLNAQMADLDARLPRMFRTLPRSRVEIRRVPVEIEQGAPGGYYQGAPLDGSRPGAYYINLKDTAEWPKWGLPTLTYHEASPGHHFQVSLAREAGELPIYRRANGFSAFNEGWALYAERVADELGVYENDPFGKIGYLQSYLFRATRLVVDTGLHHKRWSREEAIRWMVDNAAEPEGSAVREIERYCVMPGQACSYKIGQTLIARLRSDAEARLGARFDIREFHDVLLLSGSIPLSVVERRVGEWITSRAG